jgi:uncharacterized protein YfcZ (UPF0381/DUF406 family)
MAQNKTVDLKNHCFLMMEELTNPENDSPEKMKELIERAKAVANLGATINNTMKIELAALKLAEEFKVKKEDLTMLEGKS